MIRVFSVLCLGLALALPIRSQGLEIHVEPGSGWWIKRAIVNLFDDMGGKKVLLKVIWDVPIVPLKDQMEFEECEEVKAKEPAIDPGVMGPLSPAKAEPITFNLNPSDVWFLPGGSKTQIGFAPDASSAEAAIRLIDHAKECGMTIRFKRQWDGTQFKGSVTLSPD